MAFHVLFNDLSQGIYVAQTTQPGNITRIAGSPIGEAGDADSLLRLQTSVVTGPKAPGMRNAACLPSG